MHRLQIPSVRSVIKKMPLGGARSRFVREGDTEWTCGDCLTLAESREVFLKYVATTHTLECAFCGVLPLSAFSEAQRNHVSHKDRRVLCRSCRSPKCTNPECPTCPQCRQVECIAPGRCGREPEDMHQWKIPSTKEEIASFRCGACELIPCSICGDHPRHAFDNLGRSDIRNLQLCKECSHPQCVSPAAELVGRVGTWTVAERTRAGSL